MDGGPACGIAAPPRLPLDAPGRVGRDRLLVGALLAYLAIQLVYFALHVAPGIPPDELTHLGRCQAYARAWLLPADSEATHALGLITHRPCLYNLLMGKLLWLNRSALPDLLFLRLLNVPLGLLTVLYGYAWVRQFTPSRPAQLLFVAMAGNILMVNAMFASVSYDNLANLLAAAAIFHLFAYRRRPEPAHLVGLLVAVLAGCMTKRTFLPLAFILVVVLLAGQRHRLRAALREALVWLRWRRPGRLAAGMAVLVLLLSNGAVYGANLVRFGRLVPESDQVLGVEAAMRNRIFARNHVVRAFRAGRLEFEQALRQAESISDDGDRQAAVRMLYLARRPEATVRMHDHVEYVARWAYLMLQRTLGYTGHRFMMKPAVQLYPYCLVLLVAVVAFVRTWHPRRSDGAVTSAFAIALFYALVLLCLVNHRVYVRTGLIDMSLQGRYLFPVLVPLCGLVAHHLLAATPSRYQRIVAVATGAWFVYGAWPFFLTHPAAAQFVGAG